MEFESADANHITTSVVGSLTLTQRAQLYWSFGAHPRILWGTTAPTSDTNYDATIVTARKPVVAAITVANTTTETTLGTASNISRRTWFKDSATVRMTAWGTVLKNNASTGDLDFTLWPQDATAPATIRVVFLQASLADSATRYFWKAEGIINAVSSGVLQKGYLRVTIATAGGSDVVTRSQYETGWAENMTMTDWTLSSSILFRTKWSVAHANLSVICENVFFEEIA
jgi:hypothetical protein